MKSDFYDGQKMIDYDTKRNSQMQQELEIAGITDDCRISSRTS